MHIKCGFDLVKHRSIIHNNKELAPDFSMTSTTRNRWSRFFAAACFAGAAALIPATGVVVDSLPAAHAHDVVLKSTPPDGGVVSEFPRVIILEFSGIPKETFNTIAVSDAVKSEVLFTSQPELENQIATVEVPADINPGPGEYLVGFQITSSDGHATRGKTTFTVSGDGSESDPTADKPAGDDSGFSMGLGTIIGIFAALAVVAGLAITIIKRK